MPDMSSRYVQIRAKSQIACNTQKGKLWPRHSSCPQVNCYLSLRNMELLTLPARPFRASKAGSTADAGQDDQFGTLHSFNGTASLSTTVSLIELTP